MNHRKLLAIACSAGATLSPFYSLHAQTGNSGPSTNGLEEIVVISSRIETPLRQIGTSVSVLNADDIQSKGNSSLLDILRTMPSVAVSNTGGSGQVSTLRIRGEEGYRTLVLLDGMKLSDPSVTQVQPQLEHLLSSGIERVEILRGPQGLSYGADAGGVVNISTRQSSTELRSHIDVMSGAFDTQQLSGNISGGSERADFFLSGTRYETDGFNTRSTDTVLADDDGYDNTSLHARVGFNVSANLRLEAVHRDTAGDSAYDGCFNPVTFTTIHDCDASFEQQASRLSATYQTNYGTHAMAYATTETEREYFALGSSSYGSSGELTRLEYIGNITAHDNFNFVYGIDLEEEDNNGETRDQLGYYAEYLSTFSENFFVTAGVRRDDNDDFGKHTSYRISSAYLFDLSNDAIVKVRGSLGTGFRAPSPYEASYNRNPWAKPPASLIKLTEESSKGHELAVEYYTDGGLHLEAVYFNQQIEDAINFDSATYSGYLQDIGTSTSEGIELSATVPLHQQWTLETNYTYNKTRKPDGTQRQLRPKNLANLGLAWNSADDRIKVSGFYRTSRDSSDVAGGVPVALKDYDVIDLTVSYNLSDLIHIYGRVENLADEDYVEVLGYNTAGRSAYVGVRFNF
ncbi:MAG: TonB-dependent receptor [Gammaproteobacteria bacterium]|nr:TonB-dependent receptor [Gammaproteobacteria bacterium]